MKNNTASILKSTRVRTIPFRRNYHCACPIDYPSGYSGKNINSPKVPLSQGQILLGRGRFVENGLNSVKTATPSSMMHRFVSSMRIRYIEFFHINFWFKLNLFFLITRSQTDSSDVAVQWKISGMVFSELCWTNKTNHPMSSKQKGING